MPRIVLPGEPLIDGPTALRPWRDTDAGAIASACRDPDIAHWTPVPVPYGDSDARAFLHQRYDVLHGGVAAPFAIVAAPDGVLLGSVALNRVVWEHLRSEVGYWLAPEARGHGHATRAVRLACAWGFRALGLGRIELLAATENVGSQAVAERSGFTREAVLRSYMRGREGRLDMVAYGLLPAEVA